MMIDIGNLTKELQLGDAAARCLREAFEQEEAMRKKLQAEGIARAKERGVQFGRPQIKVENIAALYERYINDHLSISEVAKLCGISRSTIHRKLRTYREHLREKI